MSRHRTRRTVAAALVLGLVILASLSGGVLAVESHDSVKQNTDHACADASVDIEAATDTEVPGAALDHPSHAFTPGTTAPDLVSAASGIDLVPSSIDDTLSQVERQAGDVGDGLPGPSGLVALAGYSRFSDDDPLAHSLRADLYETISASPGIYPAVLTEQLDAPRSTLRYHLRVLEEADLVSTTTVDGRRRYVATEADAAERALAVVDEGTTAAAVVERLGRDGAATVNDLSEAIGRSPATVSYHLDRLETAGVVDRTRDGQIVRNRLTREVSPLVTSVSASTAESYGAATDD